MRRDCVIVCRGCVLLALIVSRSLAQTGSATGGGGSVSDFAPSVSNGKLTVQPGRVRFGTSVCTNFTAPATASISGGTTSGIAKLYLSDSCALVIEYPNTMKLTFALSNITAGMAVSPGVPVTGLHIADVYIVRGMFDSVVDKRSVYSTFAPMAGSGIVLDCTAGPCLFSTDPAVVMTLGGTNATTGIQDDRNASRTFPSRTAASEPANCIVGEQFFDTTANVRKDCVAPNRWSAPGGAGKPLYQKIDSQAGYSVNASGTGATVGTTAISSIAAGKCIRWSWAGWASAPAQAAAISYGSASLAIPTPFAAGNGGVLEGIVCNNRGAQNAQTLSAWSARGQPLQYATGSVDATRVQNLTLTITGQASVTTQLWTVFQVN